MPSKTTQICPQCEQPFSFYASVYPNGRVYCSFDCRKAASRIITNCPECGKEFWHLRTDSRRVHCSVACMGKGAAKRYKGRANTWLRGEQPAWQNRVDLTCEVCAKAFRVQVNESKGRRFCSKACKAKWQETAIAGENNFHWRGGYESYYGPNWRQQRRNARRRDNYACQRCGVTEDKLCRQLDVHHIKPFRHYGIEYYQEANRLANLMSLCASCHLTVEHEQNSR